jgi:hypothetical protein
MIHFSPVHGDKLAALLANPKLPAEDIPAVQEMIRQYELWLQSMQSLTGSGEEQILEAANLLNAYRLFLDLVIFDREADFLYRQKGQLKLDGTVLEEFLPIFVTTLLKDQFEKYGLSFGSATSFSSIYFDSRIAFVPPGGGLNIREKDQDFIISRPLFLRASHEADFTTFVTKQTNLAYVAVECKTNLDKTMFQEAVATALDLKTGLPAAKYYLLCEWSDMTPISSSTTAIDEVIILRKAKRLPSHVRNHFSTLEGRRTYRNFYEDYLREHPFAPEMLARLINHLL